MKLVHNNDVQNGDGILIHQDDVERELKDTIDELRKIEDKFYRIFDLNPCPMSIHRMEDKSLIDINEAFINVVEAKSKFDIIGKNTSETGLNLLNSKHKNFFLDKLKEDGIAQNYLFTFKNMKGRKLRGLISGSIIELNGQKCLLSICQILNKRCITKLFCKTYYIF